MRYVKQYILDFKELSQAKKIKLVRKYFKGHEVKHMTNNQIRFIIDSEKSRTNKKHLNIIESVVQGYFEVPNINLDTRDRDICQPRQFAISLAKKCTKLSRANIGAKFGGKDHATVLHACKVIDNLVATEADSKRDYKILLKTIEARIGSEQGDNNTERIEILVNNINERLNALKIANATNCEYYTILINRLNDLQAK